MPVACFESFDQPSGAVVGAGRFGSGADQRCGTRRAICSSTTPSASAAPSWAAKSERWRPRTSNCSRHVRSPPTSAHQISSVPISVSRACSVTRHGVGGGLAAGLEHRADRRQLRHLLGVDVRRARRAGRSSACWRRRAGTRRAGGSRRSNVRSGRSIVCPSSVPAGRRVRALSCDGFVAEASGFDADVVGARQSAARCARRARGGPCRSTPRRGRRPGRAGSLSRMRGLPEVWLGAAGTTTRAPRADALAKHRRFEEAAVEEDDVGRAGSDDPVLLPDRPNGVTGSSPAKRCAVRNAARYRVIAGSGRRGGRTPGSPTPRGRLVGEGDAREEAFDEHLAGLRRA